MLSQFWIARAVGRQLLAFAILASVATAAFGEDTYWDIRVVDMKFTEGKLPAAEDSVTGQLRPWMAYRSFQPYAVLDGEGEAYVDLWWAGGPPSWQALPRPGNELALLAMRLPGPRKVSGSLFWPKTDYSGMVKLRFVIESPPQVSYQDAKIAFNRVKQSHYWDLMDRGVPGGAWFRHQYRVSDHNRDLPNLDASTAFRNRNNVDTLDQTFALLSGGRAMSENLQLDRALTRTAAGEEVVPLDKIEGISVAEIDWKPLLNGMEAKLDPLAKLVPADQHVALFPSFSAFVRVADRLAEQGTIILRLAEAHAKDERLASRYERQLGVSLDGLGRIVGPKVIGSVAFTGSDPYFESGTDVALVFETAQPGLLKSLLLGQIAAQAQPTTGARPVAGELGCVSYSGMRSDDRAVSSYVAALPGAVLLTNSPYQVERFAAVANQQAPAIASLDEFTFFRNRYPLGDEQESALVFLSDATIRRWCGPRWRIGASRELRDAAVLGELQAEYTDRILKKQIEAGPLHTDLPMATGDALTLGPSGPRSATLGDLAFMTPISELKFDQVTKTEADAYKRWRDGYQENWRWAFDPIALRLSVAEKRLAADLTVMPLIAGSEYRRFITISRGATISPDAGDRHDALAQWIMAINVQSDLIRSAGNGLASFQPGGPRLDPLSWLGQSISIAIDRDPFWEELARRETEGDRRKFTERNLDRLPAGLWIEVSNGFKLTAFLAGLRKFVEQTAPGMTIWESHEYRGEPFVQIKPTARALPAREDGGDFSPQLLYVASGRFLFLTPSEAMVKRFLDRQQALRPNAAEANKKTAPVEVAQPNPSDKPDAQPNERPPQPWLGSNVGLQVDRAILPLLSAVVGTEYQARMQTQSWSNVPILNEWRRLYPERDPIELHASVWHENLVCPGGGKYVWNEAWQTMESTVYGHPGQPKTGPNAPPGLLEYSSANFGLTFEEHGLRARVILDRETMPEKPATAAER